MCYQEVTGGDTTIYPWHMGSDLSSTRGFPVGADGYPVTIEGLERQHPRWLVRERVFADGPQYEARRKGTTERVVRSSCPELSRAMDAADASWDWSAWAI